MGRAAGVAGVAGGVVGGVAGGVVGGVAKVGGFFQREKKETKEEQKTRELTQSAGDFYVGYFCLYCRARKRSGDSDNCTLVVLDTIDILYTSP